MDEKSTRFVLVALRIVCDRRKPRVLGPGSTNDELDNKFDEAEELLDNEDISYEDFKEVTDALIEQYEEQDP